MFGYKGYVNLGLSRMLRFDGLDSVSWAMPYLEEAIETNSYLTTKVFEATKYFISTSLRLRIEKLHCTKSWFLDDLIFPVHFWIVRKNVPIFLRPIAILNSWLCMQYPKKKHQGQPTAVGCRLVVDAFIVDARPCTVAVCLAKKGRLRIFFCERYMEYND